MKKIFKMEILGHPEYIDMAKMAVATVAAMEGFDIECVEDIKIAVAEACKSITCHGHEGWSDTYEVHCILKGDEMTVIVLDSECLHSRVKEGKPCMDCPREGDLGRSIIKSLMDEVEIIRAKNGCKSIKMVKRVC